MRFRGARFPLLVSLAFILLTLLVPFRFGRSRTSLETSCVRNLDWTNTSHSERVAGNLSVSTSYGGLSHDEEAFAIPVLGVMIINGEDLLFELLQSIDHVVLTLVIFHNADSDEGTNAQVRSFIESLQLNRVNVGHDNIKRVLSLYRTTNLGFSAGVNKMVLATREAPYWLFASNDVRFHPGMLREIARSMSDTTLPQNSTCLWALSGDPVSPYASFVLTSRAVKAVGFFDENFWPAYAEDCDYTARLVRAQCPILFEKDITRIASHETSASLKRASIRSTYPKSIGQGGYGFNNFDYLSSKWGVNVCGLRLARAPFMSNGGFNLPFDLVQNNLSTWKVDMRRRASRGGPSECIICSAEEIDHTSL